MTVPEPVRLDLPGKPALLNCRFSFFFLASLFQFDRFLIDLHPLLYLRFLLLHILLFLFPILQDSIGNSALLFIIAGCCLVGLTVTAIFRIETKGKSLDEISSRMRWPGLKRLLVGQTLIS